MTNRYLLNFADERACDPGYAGHKYLSLARAHRAGFAVPPAVVISAEADAFVREQGRWPEGLREALLVIASELGLAGGLSVRSSATKEDLQDTSFAGQYATVLDVRAEDDLLAAVETCWASAHSELVQAYLAQKPLEDSPAGSAPLMGVVIQTMVHPCWAGVAFSRDPMAPSSGEVVVEAVPGLGEELVSGHVTPVRARIQREGGLQVEDRPGGGGPEASTWREIAELARRAEGLSGEKPVDIEWALDGEGKLWLLQARAITTLGDSEQIPPGSWTRQIADDLWADQLTPFMAEVMVRHAPRFDFSAVAGAIGLELPLPTMSVIGGYLYVNCGSIRPLVELLPRALRLKEITALLPPGSSAADLPAPRWGRLLGALARLFALTLRQPLANLFFCEECSRRGMEAIGKHLRRIEAMPDETAREALRRVRATVAVMGDLQESNQWAYGYATTLVWALRWVCEDLGGLSHAGFLALISGASSSITASIERDVAALVSLVRQDPLAAQELSSGGRELSLEALPRAARDALGRFVDRYGCRSRHRTLLSRRWSEEPGEVMGMLALLLQGDEERSSSSTATDRATLLAELPLHWRIVARLLAGKTRRFLDLREDLRFALDGVLFTLRRSLLALGERLGLGDGVLFLESDQLDAVVEGTLPVETARAFISSRREAFENAGEPYLNYHDGRAFAPVAPGDGVLRGIGTSPGRAEGRVRIVEDPTHTKIESGDLLVAANTDPGWTPILGLVAGVVVEEGGLLNHCSIVARELGIPAVVGVRGATRLLQEGELVAIDGGLGSVRRLQKSVS